MTKDITETVRAHAQTLYKTALAILRNPSDAEDAVQDCFTCLWEKRPLFASGEHERAWLLRVTVNLCKSQLRRRKRQPESPLSELLPAEREPDKELLDLLDKLNPDYRTAIHLHYYEGYDIRSIANITRCPAGTVKSRLSRARVLLKDMLTESEVC